VHALQSTKILPYKELLIFPRSITVYHFKTLCKWGYCHSCIANLHFFGVVIDCR